MRTKEEYELEYFSLIDRHVTDLPNGRVIHKDAPDFRIHSTGGILGIEITRIMEWNSRREQSERELVVEAAQQKYEQSGRSPVVALVDFNAYPDLHRQDRMPLASAIADLVAQSVPFEGQSIELEDTFDDLESFPEKVACVHLIRPKNYPQNDWRTGGAGWVDSSFQSELQLEIDRKNQKLVQYREHCEQCWLVVGADWECSSSFYQFSEAMQSCIFRSAFDRTFFAESGTGKVNLLSTLPS